VRPRRSPLDVAFSLLVCAVQLASAGVVLGRPDLGAARDFLTGTTPSMAGSLAAAQVLLWAVLAVAFAVSLLAALTRSVGSARRAVRTGLWSSVVVLAVGLVVLAAGAGHHAAAGAVGLSGGSLTEARAQLHPDR
jgi:hypothetical protein